jgi:hypothetical protein
MPIYDITACMSEEVPEKTTSTATTWTTVCTLVVLAYLLSPGLLATGAVRWGWKPNETVEKAVLVAYVPLGILVKWRPAAEFYAWYLSLCSGEKVSVPP